MPAGSSISRSPSWLGTLILVPSIASIAEISTWWIRSWPRIGPRRTSKPKLPLKKAWKMSSTEPKPPRRGPGAAQALVAVGVVGTAPLGVGEHLVGFRGRLELLLGLGVVVVDVGVQLAGEAAEGGLHLGFVGVAVDAEDLVVVAGHQP